MCVLVRVVPFICITSLSGYCLSLLLKIRQLIENVKSATSGNLFPAEDVIQSKPTETDGIHPPHSDETGVTAER